MKFKVRFIVVLFYLAFTFGCYFIVGFEKSVIFALSIAAAMITCMGDSSAIGLTLKCDEGLIRNDTKQSYKFLVSQKITVEAIVDNNYVQRDEYILRIVKAESVDSAVGKFVIQTQNIKAISRGDIQWCEWTEVERV